MHINACEYKAPNLPDLEREGRGKEEKGERAGVRERG